MHQYRLSVGCRVNDEVTVLGIVQDLHTLSMHSAERQCRMGNAQTLTWGWKENTDTVERNSFTT
eukprot:scaffold823_cov397-Prasinococcus_capsulatus_cf.AAC.19